MAAEYRAKSEFSAAEAVPTKRGVSAFPLSAGFVKLPRESMRGFKSLSTLQNQNVANQNPIDRGCPRCCLIPSRQKLPQLDPFMISRIAFTTCALLLLLPAATTKAADIPEGFTPIFNGKDLTGWYGMPHFDHRKLKTMPEAERTTTLEKWNADAQAHWSVENGELVNDGQGAYLVSQKEYTDYELVLEYKTVAKADSGIYLKWTPQVQIWDHTDENKFKHDANLGSGGLWNNSKGAAGKNPAALADKPFGEWNQFKIRQVGARTTVTLNGKQVVDHAIMENYWDRAQPLFVSGPIELQTHGGEIRWRNLAVREIAAEEASEILASNGDEGFTSIFNGKDLTGWTGPLEDYEIIDGAVRCKKGKGGLLLHDKEYSNFVVRMEILIPAGCNNGLAIRSPGKGDPAYSAMCELQVLDSESPKYAKLDARQYHGSAYGMAAAARGYQRPVGEWNFQEVTVDGSTIKVELNGNVILKTDLSKVTDFMAERPHPGKDRTSGFFGFAGHNDPVSFRNVRIKELPATEEK